MVDNLKSLATELSIHGPLLLSTIPIWVFVEHLKDGLMFLVQQILVKGRTNPSTYQKELYVYQLGRALPGSSGSSSEFGYKINPALRRYKFWGCFPTAVSQIDLAFDSNDAISEFTVEFQVQWWESDGNGGISNAVPSN